MRRTAVTAALCFAAACGTDPAVAPTEPLMPAGDGLAALATCNTTAPRHGSAERPWACGELVQITSAVPAITSAIPNAIGVWNTVFGHDGLPKLVTSTGTNQAHTVSIVWGNTFTGTGTIYYCGANPGGTKITVYRSADRANCDPTGGTNASPSLSRLIAHELAHAVGFKHLSTPLVVVQALDHCVASLPQSGDLNGALCQAERQVVRYNYGLRQDEVDINLPFITSLEIIGQASVDSGQTRTLTAFVGGELEPVATNVRLAWSSSNINVATVSGTGTTAIVTGKKSGPVTIRVRVADSRYETADVDSAAIPFTVIGGPPPPPIGLNVTAITSNSATVRWTNATSNVATVVEIRLLGAPTWTTTQATAVGATSRLMSGLSSQTAYEVRAKHVAGTQSSVFTSPVSFTTAAIPSPTITNFHVAGCERRTAGGKTYNYFDLAWNASPVQEFGSYQIAMHHTSSVASAAVILTVPGTQTSGEVGGYLSSTLLMNRWFWVRYIRNGTTATPWVPLNPSPLATNQCLL